MCEVFVSDCESESLLDKKTTAGAGPRWGEQFKEKTGNTDGQECHPTAVSDEMLTLSTTS